MNKNNGLEQNDNEEYAKEYTSDEKIKIIKKWLVIGAIFFVIMKLLFIPMLAKFANNAHNIKILGISGTEILLYGIFIGMPVLVSTILFPMALNAIKVIKQKQSPPQGIKVFKKTKVVRGKKAIAKGVIILLLYPIGIVPITVLGYTSLNILLNSVK